MRRRLRAVVSFAAFAVAVGGTVAIQAPLLGTETVFAAVNVATVAALVTTGVTLAMRLRHAFSGGALAVAGGIWAVTVPVDIYLGYFAYYSYFATGFYYVAFGWAILRYDQSRLRGAARVYPAVATIAAVGGSAASALFARPEDFGYPRGTPWLTIVASPAITAAALLSAAILWILLACFFVVLIMLRLREAPPVERNAFKPAAVAGTLFAVTSICVTSGVILAPGVVSLTTHDAYLVIGLISIAVVGGLVAMSVRQQMFVSDLFRGLPASLDPLECQSYFRWVLQDAQFTFYVWDERRGQYLDVESFPVGVSPADLTFCVSDAAGTPILALESPSWERRSTRIVAASVSVIGIIAENVRLNVVSRGQLRQLRAASAATELARERGAALIKRDLHDGVQQSIRAARLDLEGIEDGPDDPEHVRTLAADLGHKLDTALAEVRALSRGVSNIHRPGDDDVTSTVAGIARDLRLEPVVEVEVGDLGLLREPVTFLLREALLNVRKHAGTKHVEVSVRGDGRHVRVCIADDGVGGAAPRVGSGLAGLAERFVELGGSVTVTSGNGQGTLVEASLPCV